MEELYDCVLNADEISRDDVVNEIYDILKSGNHKKEHIANFIMAIIDNLNKDMSYSQILEIINDADYNELS